MSTTVGTKGQVTIEKEIRDALGVRPGWRAFQRVENGYLVMTFRPPKHNDSLLGILADKTTVRIPPADFEEAVDRAWEESVREKFCGGESPAADKA